jgi:hypothetical protein
MADTVFNPDTFLNMQVTGALDTQRIPIPIGDYIGVIDDVKPRRAKDSALLDVFILVDGDQMTSEGKPIKEVTGLPKNVARYSCFLDLTPEGGLDLSKGKNVPLGQLREAVSQNDPSRMWSPGMLKGQALKVTIKHRMADDGSGQMFHDIKAVQKA